MIIKPDKMYLLKMNLLLRIYKGNTIFVISFTQVHPKRKKIGESHTIRIHRKNKVFEVLHRKMTFLV